MGIGLAISGSDDCRAKYLGSSSWPDSWVVEMKDLPVPVRQRCASRVPVATFSSWPSRVFECRCVSLASYLSISDCDSPLRAVEAFPSC